MARLIMQIGKLIFEIIIFSLICQPQLIDNSTSEKVKQKDRRFVQPNGGLFGNPGENFSVVWGLTFTGKGF